MKRFFRWIFLLIGIYAILPRADISAAGTEHVYTDEPKSSSARTTQAYYGNLGYEVVGGSVCITEYAGAGGPVEIPERIGGYPVTSVGDYAFYQCATVTSVKFPESLISIGDSAFRFCTSLREVKIPAGVTTLCGGAFEDCGNLVRLELPAGIRYIGPYSFEICPYFYEEMTGTQPVGLKDIYYHGSREQWNTVSIAENNSWLLAARLHCTDDIEITSQPEDAAGKYRDTVSFSVTAEGSDLRYQWQVSEDGTSWHDLGSSFSGAASSSLQVACQKAADGYQYRCHIRNATNSIYSDPARLTFTAPADVRITKHPRNFTGTKTATAKFQADGTAKSSITYRWQCSEAPGRPWEDLGPSTVGYRSPELKVTFLDKREGFRYRLVVTDSFRESAVSRAATIIIGVEKQHTYEETVSVKASPGQNGKIVKTCTFCGAQTITITYAPHTVRLSQKSFVYDGTSIRPGVSVTTESGAVIDPGNYTIRYQNNRDIGSGKVIVSFKGPYYEGSLTGTFEIKAKKGTRYTVGGLIYEIRKADGKTPAVTLTGADSKKLKKLNVPDSVRIGGRTFRVTAIDAGAFQGYRRLQSAATGNRCTIIGKNAFRDCVKLTKLTIGKSVTTIESSAFSGCKNLKRITVESKKLKTVKKDAFKGIHSKAVIRVPGTKLRSYRKLLKGKTADTVTIKK